MYLIGNGEVVPRLGRSVAERRHQHVIQAGVGFTDRNQLAALTLHGFILPCSPDKKHRGIYSLISCFIGL